MLEGGCWAEELRIYRVSGEVLFFSQKGSKTLNPRSSHAFDPRKPESLQS